MIVRPVPQQTQGLASAQAVVLAVVATRLLTDPGSLLLTHQPCRDTHGLGTPLLRGQSEDEIKISCEPIESSALPWVWQSQ